MESCLEKWPVYLEDCQLYWPRGHSASSHILKFENREFKGLQLNEAYTSFLYRKLGIPAVNVIAEEHFSLTERFDRFKGHDGYPERIHQEDLCQALGYSSFTKYENEGGPSLKMIAGLYGNHLVIQLINSAISKQVWRTLNLL